MVKVAQRLCYMLGLAATNSVLGVIAALHLGWMDQNTANFRLFYRLKAGVVVACMVLATFLVTSWAMRGPGGHGG